MRSISIQSRLRPIGLTMLTIALGFGLYSLGYRQGAKQVEMARSGAESPSTIAPPKPEEAISHTPPSRASDQNTSPANPRERSNRASEMASDLRNIGYEEAKNDIDAALSKAESMNPREQAFYVAGLFKYIAENSSPRDALTIAKAQAGTTRSFALKALVAEWAVDPSLPESQQEGRLRRVLGLSEGRYGLEAELASVLARSSTDPAIDTAWMEAFSSHPSRTEIVARLSPSMPDFDPTRTLAMAEGWTDWEKSRFADSLINNWSNQDPKSAWDWYSENPDTLPVNASDQILNTWAQKSSNDMIQSLDTFTDPEDRRLAIEAISASLAAQGTDQALDWVESLDEIEERDAGMRAVYQNTPKGIGAVLKLESGFPKIADIMPTGALVSTNLRAGDLIVQAQDSGKDPQNLYGRNMQDIVGLLRGTPGSEVEIRVLRENQATGQLEEHSAIVERDLLILESSGRN